MSTVRAIFALKIFISFKETTMRIAIIGYGGMGNFHYEKAFARYNNTEPDELIECAGIYDIFIL